MQYLGAVKEYNVCRYIFYCIFTMKLALYVTVNLTKIFSSQVFYMIQILAYFCYDRRGYSLLVEQRLPLFINSDLYSEYLLCHMLRSSSKYILGICAGV